jgi:hypothetical protein
MDLKNEDLELLMEDIKNSFNSNKYIFKRHSEIGVLNDYYDGFIVRNVDTGEEYTMGLSMNKLYNKEMGEWENANNLKTKMRFYEFGSENDYEYYALIGAFNEEQAINHYIEEVAEIEECDNHPKEVSEDMVRYLIRKSIKIDKERDELINIFNKSIYEDESFLILIDGCLL